MGWQGSRDHLAIEAVVLQQAQGGCRRVALELQPGFVAQVLHVDLRRRVDRERSCLDLLRPSFSPSTFTSSLLSISTPFSLCLSLLPLSLSRSISVSLSLFLPLSLSVSLSLCVSVSLSVSLCLSLLLLTAAHARSRASQGGCLCIVEYGPSERQHASTHPRTHAYTDTHTHTRTRTHGHAHERQDDIQRCRSRRRTIHRGGRPCTTVAAVCRT